MQAMDAQANRMDEGSPSQERSPQGHESHRHHGHHHHPGHGHHHEEPMSQDEAVRSLLVLGEVALGGDDYESAAEAYASVLKLEENETALYNLGSLYARGLGVRQDFVEGARLFHQAELLGNVRAGKLCQKCMFDFVHVGFGEKSPADVYATIAVFASRVYPEAADQKSAVSSGLLAIAATHYDRGEHAEAAKVFRAAAEFGGDGYAQYYLAVLYNAGAGLPQNDLAALYWLDRAVDDGAADVALADRDGMLDAYRQSLSTSAFDEMMSQLADWCEQGTSDVPADPAKAAYWRAVAQA